jgi:hypothetical protein
MERAGREVPLEQIIKSVQLFSGDHALEDDRTLVDLTFVGGSSGVAEEEGFEPPNELPR